MGAKRLMVGFRRILAPLGQRRRNGAGSFRIVYKDSRGDMVSPEQENNHEEMILVQIEPNDIDLFNKLLEGYDNMALVSTLDARIGRIALWVAGHAKKDLLAILRCLPIPVSFIEA